MLKPFGQDIWTADGPAVTAFLGFHYPTRMAVIRLTDGGLFVWSPTALSDDLRVSVNAIGEVRYLVAPNSLHHVFLERFIFWWKHIPLRRCSCCIRSG